MGTKTATDYMAEFIANELERCGLTPGDEEAEEYLRLFEGTMAYHCAALTAEVRAIKAETHARIRKPWRLLRG